MTIGHGFILLYDGCRCLPRHAPRKIDVRHTLRNIAVCPSHTTRLSRCSSHTARYHVCPSHTARLSGDSQCAIPCVVPHSAQYRAWCLTERDTTRGASQCVIPRVVPHSARYHAWCLTVSVTHRVISRGPSHTGYLAVSITHHVISQSVTPALSRCVISRGPSHPVISLCPSHTA